MKLKTFFAVVVAMVGIAIYVFNHYRGTDTETETGHKTAEVPDITIELTQERIENGKYLANAVYMCLDCHSERQYNRFGNEIVEGTLGKGSNLFGLKDAFPGDYYAQNITPYALKDWSDGEIFRAITKGVNKDGERMYPIMPYIEYGIQDPEDIYDIIAYLRTIPAIKGDNPRGSSNLPIEFMVDPIAMEAIPRTKPDISNKVAYGEYLVNAATCSGCHTPRDKRGAPILGLEFAGGTPFYVPAGKVYSANITPDLQTGIGGWSKEVFIERFKRFEDPGAPINTQTVEPGEFNTAMPWRLYSKMEESELEAIYEYLQTLAPVTNSVHRFKPVAQ